MTANKWLLLLYGLPAKKGAARVNLWRRLKKCGALPLKTSAYLLPDQAGHHERLQWLAQQVRDGGGEATIIHVTEIEGLGHEDIVRQFNEARAADYEALLPALAGLVARNRKRAGESFAAELEKLARQFEDLRKIDFFDCPRAQDAQMLLQRAGTLRA
ncbi:MAG TPA: Chromate resistance protein ChrB, partial [Verrucomicrobiae bacterium]|nr:Chromate resistance protein ChrB [Verrucomicrobiae bacterium]